MLKPWSDSIPPTPSPTKLRPPIRAAGRRSPRWGGDRAGSPRRVSRRPTHCWNSRFRPGRGRRKSLPSAPTRASRRLFTPALGSPCSTKFFALIRRSPARCANAWRCAPPPPAPPWRVIARILPRCARPSIFRPTPARTRPPARPAASIGCGACSRPARGRSRTRFCEPPPTSSIFRTAPTSRGSPAPCGTSWPGPGIRSRRLRPRAPPRWNCSGTRRASMPRFSRCGSPTSPWRDDLVGTRRFRCSRRRSPIRRRVAAQAASVRPIRIGSTPRPALTRRPPKRLTFWPESCHVVPKSFSPSNPNCGPRAPVGSSNFCWTTTRWRPRLRRKPRGCRIAPAVVCSIG